MKYILNPFNSDFDAVDLPSEVQFIVNGNDLELWFKGQLMHIWTYVAPVPVTGSPIGLLLCLTHS